MDRRRFLEMSALGSGALVCGMERVVLGAPAEVRAKAMLAVQGELVGRVDFANEGQVEMDAAFGSELDGRLFTALDGLSEKQLVTPEDKFYVRTRASKLLPEAAGWKVELDGLVAAKRTLSIAELRQAEKPLGLHLMECSGNTRSAHFGMISVGEWAGVELSSLLDGLKAEAGATRVLVNGFDSYAASSVTSEPGASWIFGLEELRTAGAFLALRLNGRLLSKDHGAPVRLVVPGWFGCACIKWVDRISFVDESAEATSQMTEYATRTHQKGTPKLAREFTPARIEHAAMPVRVEKWRVSGRLRYRVVGILWGGTETVNELGIRFNPEEEFVRVERLAVPQTTPWTIWSHTWMPAVKGRYTIRLAVLEPKEEPRRLESGYYARSLDIEEI